MPLFEVSCTTAELLAGSAPAKERTVLLPSSGCTAPGARGCGLVAMLAAATEALAVRNMPASRRAWLLPQYQAAMGASPLRGCF